MGCEDVCTRVFSPVTCRRAGAPEIFPRAVIDRCYTERYGPIQFAIAGKTAAVNVRARSPQEAFEKIATGPAVFRDLWIRAIGEQTKQTGFFGFGVSTETLRSLIPIVEGVAALVATAVGVGPVYGGARTLATQVRREQQGMGLDIGGLIGGISSVVGGLGQTFQNPFLSGAGQIGGAFSTAVARPTVVSAAAPVYGINPQPGMTTQPHVIRTSGAVVAGGRMVSIAMQEALPVLQKLAARFGLTSISLERAFTLIKQTVANYKGLATATLVATALGLTVDELGTLLTAKAHKRRRRMNPANARALRRAMRRLRSFDRLSARVSARLGGRARSRRRSTSRACGVCRQSPCTC